MQGKAMPAHRMAILGAGLIGTSFAAVFKDHGAHVLLVDPDETARDAAMTNIDHHTAAIELSGQAKGGDGQLEIATSLKDHADGLDLVIECGPERLEAKQAMFADLLARTGDETLLATASSAIPMSQIVTDPKAQARCLVAHPVNPPSVLRLIEICPAPGTEPAKIDKARGLFSASGFQPVVLGHEIEGFILNRLQGAVLREAYRLVDDGIASPADIDLVMKTGLGPRWALSGPFETADLNAPGGIRDHALRMGPAYKRMGEARGERVDWHPDLVDLVAKARQALLPDADRDARRNWRAQSVARLVAARDKLAGTGND
jgi:3-hydroxyacyl-CoA dehydrogenase